MSSIIGKPLLGPPRADPELEADPGRMINSPVKLRKAFLVNWAVKTLTAKHIKRHKELSARVRGQAFYCKALAGQSDFNICVNSDLSVSCHCKDVDGSGWLGDLHAMSFEEVFNGETAKNFRESLKKGVLPILSCARCGELVTTKTNNCYEQVSLPHRGIMIETNGSCNLACLSCGRQIRKLRSVKMSVHDLRKVLNQLKEFNLEKIHLYALGEPFLSNDIYDAMKTIREIMPSVYITTSTNGMLIDSRDRYLAALLMDNIVFSIDGPSQEICEKYQVGIDFRKAYENMCRLAELRDENHARRPYLVWKYVVFRWNDRAEHLRDTIRLARNAKVDAIAFWFTKSPFYGMSLRFFVNDNWRKVAPLINNRRVLYFRYDPGIHL